ncbi:MAG: hypothetical protein IPL49_22065 [Saprospirales bacterium]|nr:hypothetical protein [Saprospirales bacterium]
MAEHRRRTQCERLDGHLPRQPTELPERFAHDGALTFNFTFTMPGTYQYQCDLHVGQV